MFRKLDISPNGYYQYLKQLKQEYYENKACIQRIISQVYHDRSGTIGRVMMKEYLCNEGYQISLTTVKKYMRELGLKSIIRRKKPSYVKGIHNKIFPNLIQRNFDVEASNKVWCTDFTYINNTTNGYSYNCTIIDLYRREVVATFTSDRMDSTLAEITLQKALLTRKPDKGLILHSDQGSQYTSKSFVKFCSEHQIQQSMSKAGCPYDNAVMERYFNTLKHECLNLYKFNELQAIESTINEFVYGWYNTQRPHTYNNGKPPVVATI